MKTINLANIEKINLDTNNPRFAGFTSSREALKAIVLDQGSKLLELATDIVQEGLSPAHQILTITGDSKDSYIVVDGNRRIASLKLLTNPNFLDDVDDLSSSFKRAFKALANNFDRTTVEPISISVMDSREEANRWIELIHTGENKGRGVVTWDGVAIERFRARAPAALQVLELLKAHQVLTSEAFEKFPITTLQRLLGTPEVRTAFGLSIEDGAAYMHYPVLSLLPLLKYVINELVTGRTKVSSLYSKAERIEFTKKIPKELVPKISDQLSNPIPISDLMHKTASAKATLPHSSKSSKSTQPRKSLIPAQSKCKLNSHSPKVQAITIELRKLDLDITPHAIAVLFRVFIELSTDEYIKNNSIIVESKGDKHPELNKKLIAVGEYLLKTNKIRRDEHKIFQRIASNTSSPLSIDRLHQFVHSGHALPTANELRVGWDEAQSIFEKVLG